MTSTEGRSQIPAGGPLLRVETGSKWWQIRYTQWACGSGSMSCEGSLPRPGTRTHRCSTAAGLLPSPSLRQMEPLPALGIHSALPSTLAPPALRPISTAWCSNGQIGESISSRMTACLQVISRREILRLWRTLSAGSILTWYTLFLQGAAQQPPIWHDRSPQTSTCIASVAMTGTRPRTSYPISSLQPPLRRLRWQDTKTASPTWTCCQ